jgi:hypothetical protein
MHGFAILSLGGYLKALPEDRRPNVREVVKMLEVSVA